MSLTSIDIQSLARIVHFLNARNVLRLYASGDGLLMERMTRPHVVTLLKFPRVSPCATERCNVMDGMIHFLSRFQYTRTINARHLCHHKSLSNLITALPKSLTDLQLSNYCLNDDDSEQVANLPSGLLSLKLEFIAEKHIPILPRDLTLLSVRKNVTMTPDSVQQLPPHLLTLDMLLNSSLNNECVPFLPRHLTKLSLWCNDNLTDASLAHLPRTLVRLDLSGTTLLDGSGFCNLPPQLQFLFLGKNPHLGDDAISKLPSSLKELNLGKCTNLTVRCNFSRFSNLRLLYLRCARASAMCRFNLPPKLRVLHLEHRVGLLHNTYIAQLPRCLTSLVLEGLLDNLSDDCAKLMPINLRWLRIAPPCNFTDDFIYNLPEHIHTLIIQSCDKFTNKCMTKLPPRLRYLRMMGGNFTADALKQLPTTLREIKLTANTIIEKTFLETLPAHVEFFETRDWTWHRGKLTEKKSIRGRV